MTPRQLIAPARLASTAVLRGQTDERLIDLTRAGNARAFEAIVHRYRGPLLKYCARILPPERAEDAVQQTFLSAYKAISTGDSELNLRPWLYRIAHNSALNLLRQNGWNHEQLDESFDGVLRPDQAVEARERLGSLVASVKGLPERQRDAIVLRELEGRSYDEIAAALGVTDGAVRQLLNRARTTLRAGATALTPYGLAERIAAAASGRGAAVGERIAEICSGAGGAVSMAKVGTAVLVAGAVATGGANHALPGVGGSGRHQVDSAAASTPSGGDAARTRGTPLVLVKAPATTGHLDRRVRRRSGQEGERGGGSHRGRGERSGGEDSQRADDRSGSGDRHSGSSGGSGTGSDEGTTTSSGDRSSDSSGPPPSGGSDGSDSSGPGDGGGTVTTTTTPTTTPTPTTSDDGSGGGTSGH